MKTFQEWLELKEAKFNVYPSAYGGDNIYRLAKEREGGKSLVKPVGANYISCRSCGNQFVNKTNEDPRYFVCKNCDDARKKDEDNDN